MFDWNEFRTRIEKIDVMLKEQGWNVKDRTRVLVEVDTKKVGRGSPSRYQSGMN